MKLNYRKTFILGLGFFCISLVWPLYNFYIPLFLRNFIDSQFWINAIMTFDNILAISLIPFFASLSDRTRTSFGRRMPFLLIGIPLSAILFILLPRYTGFWSLIIILFFFNLSMSIYRAPTVALMPDITPAPLRSKANGIINFMGGLASVLVLSVGALLYSWNPSSPFWGTSILMILALIILYIFIKEPDIGVPAEEEKVSIVGSLKDIFFNDDKTTLYILMAIFFWFVGYQGIEATFSNYSVHFLSIGEQMGSIILSTFAGAFLVFAIPSGLVATKIGKRKTILIGITGLTVVFGLLGLVRVTTTFMTLPYHILMMVLFAIGGFCWASININSYPMVIESTTDDKIGTYTGLYYFFSSLAAIVGPLIIGFFVDLLGYKVMFFTGSASFAIAFICILQIKSPKDANTKEYLNEKSMTN
ncbi:MFS transporter [Alkaliphilus peptidifermentans]|uniref:Na+/melibiose symporter n=1 Tax=Alkaliphilus peptidifermentans DSM 18978 TaxID=1120976 RepID=A0A1G5JM19_9FIRM|nr:MFS transporter [Alkaliphilus peptidifermentans]SCY89435.1 Na+/melibiose symporter [Alkaliphilus peptidifermentans DSM 18978]